MGTPFQLFLSNQPLPVLTDGAWGTMLQSLGLPVGDCPDAWNLVCPERVEQVARAYVDAGSQIILTNTFGANRITLERHGLASQAAAINRAGVEISKRAAAERAKVFASIGPSGKMLMMGEVSEEDLRAAFEEQAQALAAGGADGIVIETMSDLGEIKVALAAAKATGLPVVASMTFDSGKNKDRTLMGVTPEEAAEELANAGADAIGANCGQGIEGYVSICKRLHAATALPVWIKPNAGLPEMVNGQIMYRVTPQAFAAYAPAMRNAGASFLGGCCGSNPDFIRALAEALTR
ncbi:MAG: homocysteine S-methyltransferase family protein [Anaerolineae bacterium]